MTARPPTDVPVPTAAPESGRRLGAGPGGDGPSGVPDVADLSRVLRALSAIFWGLPVTLMAFARHFLIFWPSGYDLALPTVGTLFLVYGVFRLGRFHRQERIWQQSLFSAQALGVVILGLSPFLHLWSRLPAEPLFARAVAVLLFTAVLFLVTLTQLLARLAAMLPDPATQSDAQLFHSLTAYVGTTLSAVCAVLYWRLSPLSLSEFLALPQQPIAHGFQAFMLMLVLIPVAMAMAVTWKLKEVVLAVLIGARK